jgi:hypothetical protein
VLACGNLDELMGGLAPCFARVEPRRQARKYITGLISDVPGKNCWALADNAYNALWRWGDIDDTYEDAPGAHNAEFVFDEACERFLGVMRQDLQIDPGTSGVSRQDP